MKFTVLGKGKKTPVDAAMVALGERALAFVTQDEEMGRRFRG
ncbi:MAG: hypothetical protein WCJ25_03190 [Candidatus Moraniibacteriota bacterium]